MSAEQTEPVPEDSTGWPELMDQLRGSGMFKADTLMDYLALIAGETEELPKSKFERQLELVLRSEANPEVEVEA